MMTTLCVILLAIHVAVSLVLLGILSVMKEFKEAKVLRKCLVILMAVLFWEVLFLMEFGSKLYQAMPKDEA